VGRGAIRGKSRWQSIETGEGNLNYGGVGGGGGGGGGGKREGIHSARVNIAAKLRKQERNPSCEGIPVENRGGAIQSLLKGIPLDRGRAQADWISKAVVRGGRET